ncbi:hypothetical protein [Carboxydothermus pertinax]|uniref:Conserved domain protein n=1 Tax=Carboxydothermus pertinax TaxID=870242 RepID=A0A1L8CVX3_9THEO|nr:hypothetical protein [Carboxydothermus pertinax]GAV23053.1 conserved domain protein [Carboxydothermus pertinax]
MNLSKVLENLESQEKELLKYLVEKGGWARITVVSKKIGSNKDDGYNWEKDEPKSTIGKLWAKALVFI